MTVGELCDIYLSAVEKGLIRGKRRRPKKASTIATDRGRIERHIKPLLGSRKVRDLAQHDVNKFIRDVASGKTATDVRTKPRGRARVTGGRGTASRTVGLLGGILSYAVSEGVIETNPARGAERFEDNRRAVRLTPSQYRDLGRALVSAESEGQNKSAIEIAWLICLSGCRRGEAVGLQPAEIDKRQNVLNLIDSKEGTSIRPIGTAPMDRLKKLNIKGGYMFPATGNKKPYGGFPKAWQRIVRRAEMPEITPHVLRHSFASEAHDLGFSEPTIAALLGHHSGSTTRGYIHHVDSALIMAADSVSRHILGMMLGRPSVTPSGIRE
ncbi:MAG: tyrosine-type recombinase/integrase [Alphaproteobacteria bacterium]